MTLMLLIPAKITASIKVTRENDADEDENLGELTDKWGGIAVSRAKSVVAFCALKKVLAFASQK
jgi:hypothetical protein